MSLVIQLHRLDLAHMVEVEHQCYRQNWWSISSMILGRGEWHAMALIQNIHISLSCAASSPEVILTYLIRLVLHKFINQLRWSNTS